MDPGITKTTSQAPAGLNERKEYVIKTSNPYVDARGRIDNYETVYPVTMANIITSTKGSMRSNHYHPEQTQQCLLVTGSYISVYKDLAIPDGPVRSHVIVAGDLVVTPPLVAHTMIFLEDSTFINLVGGNRDHDKFGVHTIPYQLVKETEKEQFVAQHQSKR